MKIFKFLVAFAAAQEAPCENYEGKAYEGTNLVTDLLNAQINKELEAAEFYFQLSHFFKRTDYSRPNFAKFWAGKAAEEREHAGLLIDFQIERGAELKFDNIKVSNIKYCDKTQENNKCAQEECCINSMTDAYQAAIDKEIEITGKLNHILTVANGDCKDQCAEDDDILTDANCAAPHLADLLDGTFLPEQYKDIHALKTKKTQLEKMIGPDSTLSLTFNELFFDDQLL
jgi:ferritin